MITAEFLTEQGAATLSSSLTKVVRMYARGGFTVKYVMMDGQFGCITDDFDQVIVNTTATREHVTEIERQIRVIKERDRCVLAELRDVGYEYYPKMFVIHCIYFCVMMLNGAIADNGISDKYSP